MAVIETGLSVVSDALLMAGITGQGQVPSQMDTNLAFRRLNGMVSLWNTKRWMIFHLIDLGFTSDGRITPYTVGPGGNYNIARRPDRLEYAFLRQLVQNQGLPVDTPLKVWQAKEQYDANTLKKNFVSYPAGVFLDTTWPLGNLYVFPWATASVYQVFIVMKDVLPIFTPQTLMSTLPDQYLECMKLNLARLLRQNYGRGRTPDLELNAQAKDALNTVKNSNIQVPELVMGAGVPGTGGGQYNIYSDSQG